MDVEKQLTDDRTAGSPPEGEQPVPAAGAEASELDLARARVAELESALAQMKDQLLRKAADFDNYKKRAEGEYADRVRLAAEDLIADLLPVIDDFDRSLKAGKGAAEPEVLFRGIELIHQKLLKILESRGLKHYGAAGQPFDAFYHDALLQVPKPDVPPHTVVEEVEKGYMLHDKVLRHAKVIVSSDEGNHSSNDEPSSAQGQPGEAGRREP